MRLVIIFAVLFLSACVSEAVKPDAVKPEAIKPRVTMLAWGDRPEWTSYLIGAVTVADLQKTNPKDMAGICPNYAKTSSEDRIEFWAQLVSIMSKYESNFKPETSYTEGFKDAKGKPVISRGLLQISIESANSYGCGFRDAKELHDAKKNLACGVQIIKRWVSRDDHVMGAVGKNVGCGRYWSVCRTTSKSNAKIKAYLKATEVCK